MAKIYLICGKICCGKTYYSKNLAKRKNSVILSCDELTRLLADDLGGIHDIISEKIKNYLLKKAAEIALCNTDVILDWGFWTQSDRDSVTAFFTERHINIEWHYIDITEEQHRKNIIKRNAEASGNDYYVDEGLLQKCLTLFQEPHREEIAVWHISD